MNLCAQAKITKCADFFTPTQRHAHARTHARTLAHKLINGETIQLKRVSYMSKVTNGQAAAATEGNHDEQINLRRLHFIFLMAWN